MRSTLADLKASRVPAVLNLSPEDNRLVAICNEAQQRIVQTGEMFWGLYGRYNFCVTDGCLTWPREIAAIESVAVCGRPITIRNEWFEFLESSYGIQNADCGNTNRKNCGGSQLYDRGSACTFADIIGVNKKIKIYADVAEDAQAVILLQGRDENGNWIRTLVDGEWVDGEYVGISTTPQTSFNLFSSLVSVQKPATKGTVRLYEYDTDLTTQRAIAIYQPDENNPSYRRSFIGGLTQGRGCCGNTTDGECVTTTVTVEAKLEFIPVQRDADWLMVGNIPALKDAMSSVLKYEMDLAQEGAFWQQKALATLRQELRHYIGNPVTPIRMQPRRMAGAGVVNMIG